jgi:multisubunit Na+/H+ antiporter MnhE subunit
MRRVTSFAVWFALLEGLWAMLVGTQQDTELAAGFVAAALGALFADALRGRGLLDYTTDFRMLVQGWRFVWIVPFDFVVVTWVLLRSLVHGRRVRGEFVRTPFPTRAGSTGRWQRAFAATLSTGAPNAIIVDLDEDEALLHSLEKRVFTGTSVL